LKLTVYAHIKLTPNHKLVLLNMINKEKFRENFQYYDKEVVVQVMDIFNNEYPQALQELQQSIAVLDFPTLNRKAHGLKGVVAYMSTELSGLCHELEQKGAEQNSEGLQPTYNLLQEGILELVDELKLLRTEYEE
jgi:HPt (histidine-containing phosphotransfer) domain-containing protein